MNIKLLTTNNTVKFLLLVILAVIFLSIGRFFHINGDSYKSFFSGVPVVLSGIIFIIVYVVVTFFIWLGPKDIFRITAAVIYGAYLSTLLVWAAEMINVVIFFTLSRKLGRGFVESKLRGKMKHVDQAIAETNFWRIFLMRVFIVPFRFLDLAFGLTKISLKKYFTIAFIGSPLRLFLFQYYLTLGVETIKDPHQLAEHLIENPWVLWLTFAYCTGAFAVIYLMKKKSEKDASPQGWNF